MEMLKKATGGGDKRASNDVDSFEKYVHSHPHLDGALPDASVERGV